MKSRSVAIALAFLLSASMCLDIEWHLQNDMVVNGAEYNNCGDATARQNLRDVFRDHYRFLNQHVYSKPLSHPDLGFIECPQRKQCPENGSPPTSIEQLTSITETDLVNNNLNGWCSFIFQELTLDNYWFPKTVFCDDTNRNLSSLYGSNSLKLVNGKIQAGKYMGSMIAIPNAYFYRPGFSDTRVLDCQQMVTLNYGLRSKYYGDERIEHANWRILTNYTIVTKPRIYSLLQHNGGGSYYYSLIEEFAANLFLGFESIVLNYPGIVIAIDPSMSTLMLQWCQLLGIAEERVIQVPRSTQYLYHTEMLYIPVPDKTREYNPARLYRAKFHIFQKLGLRMHLLDELPLAWEKSIEKDNATYGQSTILVIQRSYRGSSVHHNQNQERIPRTILNFRCLMDSLANEFPNELFVEFDKVESQLDTAKIFNRAKVIIATHGAGISNILFSPVNAALVEIHPEKEYQDSFVWLANAMGMPYYGLTVKNASHSDPFHVNIPDVLGAVHAALGE